MKLVVGSVLYQPEKKHIDYVRKLSGTFPLVYVYDNGHGEEWLSPDDPVKRLGKGENEGLPRAYNHFLKQAKKDGADFLLILDEDSCYPVEKLCEVWRRIKEETRPFTVALFKIKGEEGEEEPDPSPVSYVENVVSSGCFIRVSDLLSHRLCWDEKLFLDHVDGDFCLKLKRKGLKILQYNDLVVRQNLGYRYKGRICHAPVRHYYIVRDQYYMDKKYHRRRRINYLVREMLLVLFEDQTLAKEKEILRGFADYLRGVCGKGRK